MTENQLIYFTTICACGSYSEAALELNISQSSISKQIMQLEDELGVKLFDRSLRNISLTSAGESILADAQGALSSIQRLKSNAEKLRPDYKKRFTILTLPVIGQFRFYVPIRQFEMAHPDYAVQIIEMEEPEMFRRIRNNDYDAAILFYDPSRITDQVRFFPIVVDEMVIAVNTAHPLGHNTSIIPSELNNLKIMGMEKYTCISHLYDHYFWQHNISPQIDFRGRPETILGAAEANNIPALVTRMHAGFFQVRDIKLIPFDPPLKTDFGVAIDRNRLGNSIFKEFVGCLSSRMN